MGVELDGANQKVVLDNDSDTYLQASTDDTLDIYIAGAKDFVITANTLTAESGSGVVVPDGGLTLGSTAISSTAAELNYNDIATLGTTAASKAFTADANNLTKITGAVYMEEATLTFDATQIGMLELLQLLKLH